MTIDARLERLYQEIELVRGSGDPKRKRLCIMSLVAFLAGEAHSDNPATASSLIRRYAVVVNDAMPDHFRQRLKVFAPRLIGTNDGEDVLRARLLCEAAQNEILPRIAADFRLVPSSDRHTQTQQHKERSPEAITLADLVEKVAGIAGASATWPCDNIASELAKLIAQCGSKAQGARGEWYWLKAIDLLDRLCDVRVNQSSSPVREERLDWIEIFLDRNGEALKDKIWVAAPLANVRWLLASLHALI